MPSFNSNSNSRKKRYLTTILGTIASKVIGLAFEGISSFLHHKRHKVLQTVVNVINFKAEIDHYRFYHLEDTMIMYGKYNSDTLMDLINTVHIILNDKDIYLPMMLVIPLIHKVKVRKLFSKRDLLHVYIMLKQRKSWYNLECE